MIDPPFRSPRERVGGLYYFGRMLDKIRCHLREKLPEEYRPNFGLSVGLDGTRPRHQIVPIADSAMLSSKISPRNLIES